ncbi:MAG TPA: hypothetical protein VJU83_10370 [Burkholderiales bacterium]|nr:hypothetical protein [Burkholderiales bacterium]
MKIHRNSSFTDRLVMSGGLLAVVCTGFFGAEPPSPERLSAMRTIPYIQLQCDAEARLRSRWCSP